MPVRFAVASTSWNTPSTWDNGAVPVAGDTVYPNGFTVPIDTDISVASLNNNIPPVYLPNMNIPLMTNNTQPNGIANASSNATIAFRAFDQSTSTQWNPTTNATGWISYDYGSNKLIKRYYILGTGNYPTKWTFDGWDSATSQWVTLEDKTLVVTNSSVGYFSPLLGHTAQYSMYRINVTANSNSSFPPQILNFEMTESTSASFGSFTGGSFTVPSSLSGTRNITFSGAGLMGNQAAGTLLTLDNNLTNTVNLNKTSGAYIINPLYNITDGANTVAININNNGIVNFNGDLYGTTTNLVGNTNGIIRVVSNSTITVNGNLYPIAGRSSTATYLFNFLSTSTNSTLTINGDVIGGNLYSNTYALFIQSVNTVNIVGNLTSNAGYCYYSTVASFLNLTGSANLTNINSVPCVLMGSATSLLTMNGAIINKGNVMAVSVQKMRYVSTATPYWIFQTTGASDMTLAYGAATGPYPAEADVRYNTAYGASPTRYGTLRVPLPQYVSQGVLTDNTTGTAYLSATDVWNVLTSNITTAGSIGERLKNASTVQTNGDQLAAYIV